MKLKADVVSYPLVIECENGGDAFKWIIRRKDASLYVKRAGGKFRQIWRGSEADANALRVATGLGFNIHRGTKALSAPL